MFHYRKWNTENLISQGLYQLMLEKPFDKITIRQICDKAKINRGTFYNHFIDKYKALEYLIHLLLIDEQSHSGNKDDHDLIALIAHMNLVFYNHQEFFYNAFKIQGQNNFEDMLLALFNEIFMTLYDYHGVVNKGISKELFVSYQGATYLFMIKQWMETNYKMSPDELLNIYLFLTSHSFKEMIEEKEKVYEINN